MTGTCGKIFQIGFSFIGIGFAMLLMMPLFDLFCFDGSMDFIGFGGLVLCIIGIFLAFGAIFFDVLFGDKK